VIGATGAGLAGLLQASFGDEPLLAGRRVAVAPDGAAPCGDMKRALTKIVAALGGTCVSNTDIMSPDLVEVSGHLVTGQNDASARRVIAEMLGLLQGVREAAATPCELTLQTLDVSGLRMLDANCRVELEGPTGAVPFALTNQNDGTFLLACDLPNIAGEFKVHAFIEAEDWSDPMEGFPLCFTAARVADAGRSFASGRGLKDGKSNEPGPAEFAVHACDTQGRAWPGAACTVSVRGPQGEVKAIVRALEGPIAKKGVTHVVAYPRGELGSYELNVALNGQTLSGFPRTVRVTRGAQSTAGCKFEFTVLARDDDGKILKEGGDLFQVTVSDESGKLVAVKARDMGDGRYSASYMLRDPVLYTVRAHLNGRELDTSPFTHDMRVCREGKKPGVS